jgi:hypothetical protein
VQRLAVHHLPLLALLAEHLTACRLSLLEHLLLQPPALRMLVYSSSGSNSSSNSVASLVVIPVACSTPCAQCSEHLDCCVRVFVRGHKPPYIDACLQCQAMCGGSEVKAQCVYSIAAHRAGSVTVLYYH